MYVHTLGINVLTTKTVVGVPLISFFEVLLQITTEVVSWNTRYPSHAPCMVYYRAGWCFGGSTKIDIWIFATLCGQFTALFRLSYMNLVCRNHFWNLLEPPGTWGGPSCPPPAILSIVAIQPVGWSHPIRNAIWDTDPPLFHYGFWAVYGCFMLGFGHLEHLSTSAHWVTWILRGSS